MCNIPSPVDQWNGVTPLAGLCIAYPVVTFAQVRLYVWDRQNGYLLIEKLLHSTARGPELHRLPLTLNWHLTKMLQTQILSVSTHRCLWPQQQHRCLPALHLWPEWAGYHRIGCVCAQSLSCTSPHQLAVASLALGHFHLDTGRMRTGEHSDTSQEDVEQAGGTDCEKSRHHILNKCHLQRLLLILRNRNWILVPIKHSL